MDVQSADPNVVLLGEPLSLVNRKFYIFPCVSRGKRPAIVGWPDRASYDIAQIEAWVSEFRNCNWGIAAWKSGFFALDIDRKTTPGDKAVEDGFEMLEVWSKEHPETPDWLRTASIRTARGTHYLFGYPADQEIPNSVGLLATGIDIRGWHGYIMAPGSIHPSGTVYQWLNDGPIVPAPRWLLEKIEAASGHPAITADQLIGDQNGETKINSGRRNATLTSFAGSMRRRGMVQAAIEAALHVVNREQCEMPLPEIEVTTIARSVSQCRPELLKSNACSSLVVESPSTRRISKPDDIPDPRSLGREPVRFLVDGLIPMNAVTTIAAEYSVGKTWLGLILSAEVKRGGKFIGRDVMRCDNVIYFDRENPLFVIQDRMETVYRENENAHHHWGLWCEDEPPLLDHPLLLEFARPGSVMIFDALIRFHSADENRPTEMAAVMACLRRLQSLGATVIAFHHRDKKLEAAYRGTAEIPAACDILYSLAKEEGDLLVLRSVKARLQVDQVVTFKADWDEATLVPCESNSVANKRALITEIGDQIRRSPGISQSGVVKNINSSTRVERISRWRIQRILDQHEGALWRAEHGSSGNRTAYFDLFSTVKKTTKDGEHSKNQVQQLSLPSPAESVDGSPAASRPKESDISGNAAEPAVGAQRVLSMQPADLLPPYQGGSQRVGAPDNTNSDDDDDDMGVLV
jgi:Bifunctional DNA primase/polymerase, N-terminal/AAA domain/Primase C terminal 1 (PriCT-1)